MPTENAYDFVIDGDEGEDYSGFYTNSDISEPSKGYFGFDYQSQYGESYADTIVSDPRLQEASTLVTTLTEEGEAVPYDNASRIFDKLAGAVTTSLVSVVGALGRRESERLAPLQPAQATFLGLPKSTGGNASLWILIAGIGVFVTLAIVSRK